MFGLERELRLFGIRLGLVWFPCSGTLHTSARKFGVTRCRISVCKAKAPFKLTGDYPHQGPCPLQHFTQCLQSVGLGGGETARGYLTPFRKCQAPCKARQTPCPPVGGKQSVRLHIRKERPSTSHDVAYGHGTWGGSNGRAFGDGTRRACHGRTGNTRCVMFPQPSQPDRS